MKAYSLTIVIFLFSSVSYMNAQNISQSKTINQQNQAGSKSMQTAYELSGKIVNDRIIHEDTTNVKVIEDISVSDLVVINGTYDHIHLVLNHLELPYVSVYHNQLKDITFEPHQTVFVNCASSFPPDQARRLAAFVAKGGQLITTDWALKFVLEVAFPDYVSYNNKSTGDEVVRVEVMDKEDPVIKGFLDEETAPVWWLEGSSYPIKILDKENVNVLIRSKELKDKYGEDPVLISFKYGNGIVYHMISHFYLQRTETKDIKQTAAAAEYVNKKSSSFSNDKEMMDKAEKVNYGEVQSANTSSEFIMRAVINQKKKNMKE